LAVRLLRELVSQLQLVEGTEFELTAVDRMAIGVAKVDAPGSVLAQPQALQRPVPPDSRLDRNEANER
jgi:hypothetical protein